MSEEGVKQSLYTTSVVRVPGGHPSHPSTGQARCCLTSVIGRDRCIQCGLVVGENRKVDDVLVLPYCQKFLWDLIFVAELRVILQKINNLWVDFGDRTRQVYFRTIRGLNLRGSAPGPAI